MKPHELSISPISPLFGIYNNAMGNCILHIQKDN